MEDYVVSVSQRIYSEQDAFKLKAESDAKLESGEINEATHHQLQREVSEIIYAVQIEDAARRLGRPQLGIAKYHVRSIRGESEFVSTMDIQAREIYIRHMQRLSIIDPLVHLSPNGTNNSSGSV